MTPDDAKEIARNAAALFFELLERGVPLEAATKAFVAFVLAATTSEKVEDEPWRG